MKPMFRVRRPVVHAALLELKSGTEHPGYVDLEIDEQALAGLPLDAVPEEVWGTVRREEDAGVAVRESAGYIPTEGEAAEDGHNGLPYEEGEAEDTQDEDDEDEDDEDDVDQPRTEDGSGVHDTTGLKDPDIIPLEFGGLLAADGSQITPAEMMKSAIQNLTGQQQGEMMGEGGYIVRHGDFARDFGEALSGEDVELLENPSVYAFPCLFPYGLGGLEAKRPVRVSFTDHVRWCLQHYDPRFRKDFIFAFWAMSIEQKRQALNAARLTMSRRDFDKVCTMLSSLTPEDLQKAVEEEDRGSMPSDSRVQVLQKMVRVTMQKVMGTDASRALNRSKIWSTSLYLNPMNLWMTLNFIDRHDPICQVFAGENINMEDLSNVVHLSAHQRAKNVAQDPFAATQFFFFLANTVLETLFGFNTDGRVGPNRMGELGVGSAYFGAVEAQGRGSLHLHLIMWLANSPDAAEIALLLQTEEFRQKVKAYLKANVRSHLDDLTEGVLSAMESESELAWSRPPDPDCPTYDKDWRLLELKLARSQQYHVCTPNTCLVYDYRKGHRYCKRHCPFEESLADEVTETGEIRTKRLIKQMNAWCPTVMYGGRCNNDIKLLLFGRGMRSIIWYITNYATKKQGRSYNRSAILAKTYVWHNKNTPAIQDARRTNSLYIFRCGLSFNREQEFSSQQVMAYLMGLGDSIHSHTYSPIYWSSVVATLKRLYPELRSIEEQERMNKPEEGSEDTDIGRLSVGTNGALYLRSQIDDYGFRGDALEEETFLEYFVNTYEERIKHGPKNNSTREETDAEHNGSGRRPNCRVLYRPEHPRSTLVHRVVRTLGHRNLPNILGPWFERNNNPKTYSLYCASALACLKPWRQLEKLKAESDSWSDAFDTFILSATPRQKSILANMQSYYQSSDSADEDRQAGLEPTDLTHDVEPNNIDLGDSINGLELEEAILTKPKRMELEHAAKAVEIGKRFGMFGDPAKQDEIWTVTEPVVVANHDAQREVKKWTDNMKRAAVRLRMRVAEEKRGGTQNQDIGGITSMAMDESQSGAVEQPGVVYEGDQPIAQVATDELSDDQLRAFKLISEHVIATNSGKRPPQLLMQVQGEGGTGKSKIIDKASQLFKVLGKEKQLRKAAYTGIAASLIEGSTLHQLCLLHREGKLTKTATEQLRATWADVEYLIIDEISMVSKKHLALIDEMLGIAKQKPGENNTTIPFGGINVIVAGDFHQFPPVMGKGKSALYVDGPRDNKAGLGRDLYLQFTTVVLLTKQFRNQDLEWRGVLTRSRTGSCTRRDLQLIRELVLHPVRDKSLFSNPLWTDAVLVTPRHIVRNGWNAMATRNYCRQKNVQLINSPAYDTYDNKPLSKGLAALVKARMHPSKGDQAKKSKGDPGGLPDVVQIAVGMNVMITYNVETELDIVNGARGTVESIMLGSSEGEVGSSTPDSVRDLARPPLCVLVRLSKEISSWEVDGLEKGIVPIIPKRSSFRVALPNGGAVTVWREQLPLTPAYAFTDYRSQGQTLPHVIVDIAKPPSGSIDMFNAYVALSRSQTRQTIRLLRDFRDDLFATPPPEALVLEDARLQKLNEATRKKLRHETSEEGVQRSV